MHETLIQQLDRAVADVFETMLDLECHPVPAVTGGSLPLRPLLVASVRFSGSLVGICITQVDELAAAGLTAHLTGIAMEALSPALFPDTVAELCNMIAGSWKSMQPVCLANCTLSPPNRGAAAVPLQPYPRTLTRLYRFALHNLTVAISVA